MFKKLKDKIAEEVKQSPQRIQQIAQAVEAAVGSTPTSSTNSEVSGSDQFFSITEEDTPQNSPAHTAKAKVISTDPPATATITATTTPKNSDLQNNGFSWHSVQNPINTRQRRLSNSSMASDVSFRLPSYDSPAVYHLQSDLECSASEFEDLTPSSSAASAQLELISKEQLHSAYKKALDRYQKYRNRYTEIAKRYRDLERDNNKARSVLVETQDKALRRISELREQCALEQQAKAHLESALRLEMDEMQCVIKTMKSKLEVSGESQEQLQNGKPEEKSSLANEDGTANLLDFSEVKEEQSASASSGKSVHELEDKIKSLEQIIEVYKGQVDEEQRKHENRNKDVESLEAKVNQLKDNLNDSIQKIRDLQTREEENTILLAQNKMVVHSELENKEEEMKKLRSKVQGLEQVQHQFELDNKSLQERIAQLTAINSDFEATKHDKEVKINELEASKIKLKEEISRLEAEQNNFAKIKDQLNETINNNAKRIEELTADGTDTREQKDGELMELKTHLKLKEQELVEMLSKVNVLEREEHKLRENASKGEHELATVRAQLESEASRCGELKEINATLSRDLDAVQKTNIELESENSANTGKLKASLAQVNELQQEIKRSCEENQKLNDEIKMIKVVNENSESEAIQQLQATMKSDVEKLESRLRVQDEDLTRLKKQNSMLEQQNGELLSDVESQKQASESLNVELASIRSKVETLRNEKRDLEKTLEKEIRDKNELQTQVTNILQEIGRLEEQLNEMRDTQAALEEEKLQLQERITNMEENELKMAAENERQLQEQLKVVEDELARVQVEHNQLLEARVVAEEINVQLRNTLKEMEQNLKQENADLKEEIKRIRKETESMQSDQVNDLQRSIKEMDAKLKECLAENVTLLLDKEKLEQDLRTLADENEMKEKEKLCALDTNKSLEETMNATRMELNGQKERVRQLENDLRVGDAAKADELDAITGQRDEIANQLDLLRAEKESLVMELENAQRQGIESEFWVKKQCEESMHEMANKMQKFDETTVENEYLNTLVKQLEADLQKMKDVTGQREALYKELKEQYNYAENEMSNLQEAKSKFDCLMADKNAECEETKSMVAKLKQEMETERMAAKTQMDQKNTQMKELQEEMSAKQIIITDLNQDLGRQEAELTQMRNSQSKEGDEARKVNEELKGHVAKLEQAEGENKQSVQLIEQLRGRITELEAVVAQQSQTAKEHSSKANEMNELEDENATLKLKLSNLEQALNSKLVQLEEKHGLLIAENQSLKEAQQSEDSADGPAYEDLIGEKQELEIRLQKILNEVQEVSNRNLFLEQKCENFMILEQSNERLKSANEKLSRQLDETLVTIHHHEDGIAANTEFEYLKNIMFQYLSGNINGNNNTLVKVISAVLKFSPQQAQVVLEKENQRHTLMGQLNKLL